MLLLRFALRNLALMDEYSRTRARELTKFETGYLFVKFIFSIFETILEAGTMIEKSRRIRGEGYRYASN